MNKKELISEIARKSPDNVPASEVEEFINTFIDVISDELKRKGKVVLVGFGTFKTVHRAKRTGINPQNGSPITIPAKDVPVFTPGKALKDSIK